MCCSVKYALYSVYQVWCSCDRSGFGVVLALLELFIACLLFMCEACDNKCHDVIWTVLKFV